ncbi:MAG: hypothetical protein J6Y85_03540 [Alphaproteobacteria bacterium]|nr:hypothetical protein [Alphaproteobacteria bacterium]
MKKNIFLLVLGLTVATAAHAETTIEWTQAGCQSVGGTWITAHSPTDSGCDANHCNGMNFCRSPNSMNLFSALVWCKSIGHQLTDFETACPNAMSSGNTCANLKGWNPPNVSGDWTTMPSPTNSNRMVFIAGGTIYLDHSAGTKSSTRYALCKK